MKFPNNIRPLTFIFNMKSTIAYFQTFLRFIFLASLTQLTLLYFNLYLQHLLTQKILSQNFKRGSCCALKFPYDVRPLMFIFNMMSTKVYFHMYYFLGEYTGTGMKVASRKISEKMYLRNLQSNSFQNKIIMKRLKLF